MFSGGVADSPSRPFGNQFAWGLLFAGRQLIGSPEHIIVNIKCGSHASDHSALNASQQGPDRGQGEAAPVRRLSQDVAAESSHANAARLWLTPCSQRRPRRAASAAKLSRAAARRNQRPKFSTVSTQVSGDSRSRRRIGNNSAGTGPRLSGRVGRPVQSTNSFPASRQSRPGSGSDPGNRFHQRRATSSSLHWPAMPGRFRSTKWSVPAKAPVKEHRVTRRTTPASLQQLSALGSLHSSRS